MKFKAHIFGFFVAMILLLAIPVSAAPQQPLWLDGGIGSSQYTAWIEQQDNWPKPTDGTAMTNPFGSACLWSLNDHWRKQALGFLDPGVVSSHEACVVSDFNPVWATRGTTTAWWSNALYGFYGVQVYAPSDKLTVTICYQPQGKCFTPAVFYDNMAKLWSWRFCGRANYLPNDSALVEIPGSGGARGVVTSVTLSVKNIGSRRARDILAKWSVSSDIVEEPGCVAWSDRPANHDYPFAWTSS